MKWVEISFEEFHKAMEDRPNMRAISGGEMAGGGTYSEYGVLWDSRFSMCRYELRDGSEKWFRSSERS